jgi:hypothetical protein
VVAFERCADAAAGRAAAMAASDFVAYEMNVISGSFWLHWIISSILSGRAYEATVSDSEELSRDPLG